MFQKTLELFFAYAPGLAVGLLSFGFIAFVVSHVIAGFRTTLWSFPGIHSIFSYDTGREYRYSIPERYIAPDKQRLEQRRKIWLRRFERIKTDNADLMTVVFNSYCSHLSDEYGKMWLDFIDSLLLEKGFILKIVLPLIPAYKTLTLAIKHKIAEAARGGMEAIPIILVAEEKDSLHELESLDVILASKKQ